jgi:uncharacterized protein (TIGR02266 family)
MNYPDEETFVRKYASNVSRTGIFAKTRTPRSVGEQILFEFSLQDGAELLKGIGRVVRVRSDSSGTPLGMDIKFLKLDKKGKTLVDRIVEYKEQQRTDEKKLSRSISLPRDDYRGMAQAAESQPLGVESDMIDHNRKSAAKIDLDAIDSMLDQIAGSSISKKKRTHRKRTSTVPAPGPDAKTSAHAVEAETEAPVPQLETALEPEPSIVKVEGGPKESSVVQEAEKELKTESIHLPPISFDEIELIKEAEKTTHTSAFKTPLAPAFGLPTVEPTARVDTSPSTPLNAKEDDVEELSLDAAGIEEIEQVAEDDIIEEPEEAEDDQVAPEATEITMRPALNIPVEPIVSSNVEDSVTDLGPESETFQDVEPAREISVKSVLPAPAVSMPLSSSIPSTSISSNPAPIYQSFLVEPSAGQMIPMAAQLSRSSIPPVDPNFSAYPLNSSIPTPYPAMPASVAQQSFFPNTSSSAAQQSFFPDATPAAARQSYIPNASAPSVVPQPFFPDSSAPSVVPQPFFPDSSAPSVVPQPFFPDSSPPPAFAQRSFFPDSSPPPSVSPRPFFPDSSPPSSVTPRSFFPDTSPPSSVVPEPFFTTSYVPTPGPSAAQSSFFPEPASSAPAPSVVPISFIPPSIAPSSIPPIDGSSVPLRPSQTPLIAMAPDELNGILGDPMHEESHAMTTALIQEDELDALLNALEDSDAAVEIDEIEEFVDADIDELEVVEVDD